MMRSAERSSRSTDDLPDSALWPEHGRRLEPLGFRRTPALWGAAWFAVGILAHGFVWHAGGLWILAAGLLTGLVVAGLARRVRTEVVRLVPLAALWIVTGIVAAALQIAPTTQSTLRGFADGLSRNVQGRVVRVRNLPPRLSEEAIDVDGYQEKEAPAALSIDLEVDAVEEVNPDTTAMVKVPGGVRATIIADDSTVPTVRCGDVIEGPMRLRVPERYRDPGAWQYADYLLAQGIGAHATVRASRLGHRAGEPHRLAPGDLRCRLYAAQGWASSRMTAFTRSAAERSVPRLLRLGPDDAGMLNAMLFGDRAGLNHQLRLGFERTGSFHLFVVSGMHIGLIALGLFWLTRRARVPLWAATILTIVLTTLYAALTGFGIPVQRALGMATVVLLARLLDRRQNTLNAFGLAVVAVLAWSPSALYEASFQMTFLAIVGVAGIALPLGERTILPYARATRRLDEVRLDVGYPPRLAQFRVMLRLAGEPVGRLLGRWARQLPAHLFGAGLWVVELCLIGVVTEAVMTLPMTVYFHRATLFALPANLVSIPVIGLLVPTALATFTAALVSPWAAMLPGAATALMLHGMTGAVGAIARIRLADLRTPGPGPLVCVAAISLLALCVWVVRRRGAAWGWVTVALLTATVLLILWPRPVRRTAGRLEVTAIDVGQGDSLLVVGPGGATMLVDAGGPIGGPGNRVETTFTGFDLGEEVVAPYLWSRGIRRLDLVALTHEHSDHMGGMPAILRDFRPRELWLGTDVPFHAYDALLAEAATLGVTVRHLHAGDALPWDEVQVGVLSPEPGYLNHGAPKNDDSLVLHLRYGEATVLLAGDAERASERAMLDHARIEPVTLLKVGHHGSATSSTEAFLEAARPQDAVVSSGAGNPFGHPRTEVITRFAERHTRLYRTDTMGPVTFLLDRSGGIRTVAGTSN